LFPLDVRVRPASYVFSSVVCVVGNAAAVSGGAAEYAAVGNHAAQVKILQQKNYKKNSHALGCYGSLLTRSALIANY
jgi:hypothetical protein